MISPNAPIAKVTQRSVRRRPRSAKAALIGMASAKNTMPNNWITRNFPRV